LETWNFFQRIDADNPNLRDSDYPEGSPPYVPDPVWLKRRPRPEVPSRPDKKFCRTVEVSADSPNVLCPHAARMGDERKAVGSEPADGFAVSENGNNAI
jgi:hypothetical protein